MEPGEGGSVSLCCRPEMLSIPPRISVHKTSSVCPGICFGNALQSRRESKFELVGLHIHAHLATTNAYAEIIDVEKKTSTLLQPEPRFRESVIGSPRDGLYDLLDPPVPFTEKHTIKTTCIHNTTERDWVTDLGTSSRTAEMCFIYALVSPVIPGFSYCWHLNRAFYDKHSVNEDANLSGVWILTCTRNGAELVDRIQRAVVGGNVWGGDGAATSSVPKDRSSHAFIHTT